MNGWWVAKRSVIYVQAHGFVCVFWCYSCVGGWHANAHSNDTCHHGQTLSIQYSCRHFVTAGSNRTSSRERSLRPLFEPRHQCGLTDLQRADVPSGGKDRARRSPTGPIARTLAARRSILRGKHRNRPVCSARRRSSPSRSRCHPSGKNLSHAEWYHPRCRRSRRLAHLSPRKLRPRGRTRALRPLCNNLQS